MQILTVDWTVHTAWSSQSPVPVPSAINNDTYNIKPKPSFLRSIIYSHSSQYIELIKHNNVCRRLQRSHRQALRRYCFFSRSLHVDCQFEKSRRPRGRRRHRTTPLDAAQIESSRGRIVVLRYCGHARCRCRFEPHSHAREDYGTFAGGRIVASPGQHRHGGGLDGVRCGRHSSGSAT